MNSEDTHKICPSCKKHDLTSFHTCRYCGTNYSAKISKEGLGLDAQFLIKACIAAALIYIFVFVNGKLKEVRAQQLASLTNEIRAAHRPRVIEFYADWCGPCRAYGPVIEACQNKYGAQIDFQRLNVDNPQSRPLARLIGVSSIPRTCMFDRNGNEVIDVIGGQNPDDLEQYMQKLLTSN